MTATPRRRLHAERRLDYLLRRRQRVLPRAGRRATTWSGPIPGVRPLYDDGASKAQEATRDYVLIARCGQGAPLLNVFGGKITTYRRLAEAAMEKLAPGVLPALRGPWTAGAPLPGGDFPPTGVRGADGARR